MLASLILQEFDDYLVINKPPGLAMHSETGPGLIARLRKELEREELYPVHRLDANTSGLLLVAKTAEANRELSLLFQEKQIEKLYLALVDKKPLKSQGCVKGDMQKARAGSWRLARSNVNPAVTWFFSSTYSPGKRLVILKPLSGKTHQLRVAMKALSAPILGDKRYGGTVHSRTCLHAWQLRFHWKGSQVHFIAPFTDIPGSTRGEFDNTQLTAFLDEMGPAFDLAWPKAARLGQ